MRNISAEISTEKECQHRWGRKYRVSYSGQRLIKAIQEGTFHTKDPFGPFIEEEIIQRAKKRRGCAVMIARKCRKCGKREIVDGTLVSGGIEYQLERDGTIGPAFFAP